MALGRSPAEDPSHRDRAYALLADDRAIPASEIDDEVARIEELATRYPSSAYLLTTHWAAVLCFLERFTQAFAQTEILKDVIFETQSFSTHVVDFTFYRGLAAGAIAQTERGRAARGHRRALRASLRQLRTWARHGPDYVHMVLALEAEQIRLRGRLRLALARYSAAAERAALQGYTHHVALLHERRGRLLQGARRDVEAAGALRQALGLYREWGAGAKVRILSEEIAALAWNG